MSINMEEKNTEKEPLIRVENLKKYYPIRGGVITHTTGYIIPLPRCLHIFCLF